MPPRPLSILFPVLLATVAAQDAGAWGSVRSFNGFAHGGAGAEGGGSRPNRAYPWSQATPGHHHTARAPHGGYAHHYNSSYFYSDPHHEYGACAGGFTSATVRRQSHHNAAPIVHTARYAHPTSGVRMPLTRVQ